MKVVTFQCVLQWTDGRLSVSLQNYYEKMEKRQEKEQDSSRKEHATKLITPQVAKVEHTYRPGEDRQGPSCPLSSGSPDVLRFLCSSVCRISGEADGVQRQQPEEDDRRRGNDPLRRRGRSKRLSR